MIKILVLRNIAAYSYERIEGIKGFVLLGVYYIEKKMLQGVQLTNMGKWLLEYDVKAYWGQLNIDILLRFPLEKSEPISTNRKKPNFLNIKTQALSTLLLLLLLLK